MTVFSDLIGSNDLVKKKVLNQHQRNT